MRTIDFILESNWYNSSKIFFLIVFVCAANNVDANEAALATPKNTNKDSSQSPNLAKDTRNEDNDELVIVAFGNSITATRKTVDQVFAQRLPDLLKQGGIEVKMINSGVGGSHTGRLVDNDRHKKPHALDRFESDVLAHNPDIVTIGFGTNDAHIDSKLEGGPSRIPLEKYTENLTYMITKLQKQGARVILIAPNALGQKQGELQNNRLSQYVQVVRNLSNSYHTGLVDNFQMFNDYHNQPGQDMDDLMLDGTHPNDKGHEMIAKRLVAEIMGLVNK